MGRGNLVLGKIGENVAVKFLSKKGYEILEKNFKSLFGEVDLIARKDDSIVFIEVKTRTSDSFGPPYLSVTKDKLRHIVNSALCYLRMKGALGSNWRIDIVSIEMMDEKIIKNIELFENVYEENY